MWKWLARIADFIQVALPMMTALGVRSFASDHNVPTFWVAILGVGIFVLVFLAFSWITKRVNYKTFRDFIERKLGLADSLADRSDLVLPHIFDWKEDVWYGLRQAVDRPSLPTSQSHNHWLKLENETRALTHKSTLHQRQQAIKECRTYLERTTDKIKAKHISARHFFSDDLIRKREVQ